MVHSNAQILHLLFDTKLVPCPIVKDTQDRVDFTRFNFLSLIKKPDAAEIKVSLLLILLI